MIKVNERVQRLNTYWNSTARWYGSWDGLPRTQYKFQQVVGWFNYEKLGKYRKVYSVVELFPNGGMWSYSFLQGFEEYGLPIIFNYKVIGEEVEARFVLRDVMRVLYDKRIKLNSSARVRTWPVNGVPEHEEDPCLISQIHYTHEAELSIYKNRLPFDFAFCMDSFMFMNRQQLYYNIVRVAKTLRGGSTFICNTNLLDADYIIQTAERSDLQRIDTLVIGRTVYFRFNKKEYNER